MAFSDYQTPSPVYKPGQNKFRTPKEFIYITGKCKFARTVNPDPTYEKWGITIWPKDNVELNKLNKLKSDGVRNELKKDDDGYYMSFSRPIKIRTRAGKIIPLEAPVVIDPEGVVFNDYIGNGSDVTIKLETYGGPGPGGIGKYYAARLESVRINDLVPYTTEQLPEAEQRQVRGLNEQPQQLF